MGKKKKIFNQNFKCARIIEDTYIKYFIFPSYWDLQIYFQFYQKIFHINILREVIVFICCKRISEINED